MNVAAEMKTVEKLKTKALKEKLSELTGKVTKSNNRPYLLRTIAKVLEEVAVRHAARKTPNASNGKRDPRLPKPGTVLERKHKGKTIRVKVLEDGFEYRGKAFRSLSAVAREGTGTTWNGYVFFGLSPVPRRKRAAS